MEYELELKFDKVYWDSIKIGNDNFDKWVAGKRKWDEYVECKKKNIPFNGNENEVKEEAQKYDFYATEKRVGYSPPYLAGPDPPPGKILLKITAYIPKYFDLDIVGTEIIYEENPMTYKRSDTPKYYLKVFRLKVKKNQDQINIKLKFDSETEKFTIKFRNR